MRPNLSDIEHVESVLLSILLGHHLHAQVPAGKVAFLDCLEEISGGGVAVVLGNFSGLFSSEVLDSLTGLEVFLHKDSFTFSVHPDKGV